VSVTAVNDIPTLTSFAAVIDTSAEDTEVELTLAELKAQGDEADVDGTVDAFVVKSVTTGTLRIGADAGSATAWAAGSNDTIDASNHAYWTPAQDVNGTLNAFQVIAQDDKGAESSRWATCRPRSRSPVPTMRQSTRRRRRWRPRKTPRWFSRRRMGLRFRSATWMPAPA